MPVGVQIVLTLLAIAIILGGAFVIRLALRLSRERVAFIEARRLWLNELREVD